MKPISSTSLLVIILAISLNFMASCEWKVPGAQANVLKPSPENITKFGDEKAPVSTGAALNLAARKTSAIASAEKVMARPQIPILCYHQVRDYRSTDSRSAKDYIVPPASFLAQMKALSDSGYHTVLPEDIYKYLAFGEALPEKPVLISFDDGCDEQFDITHSVLDPLQFKASFFIMTVSVNRPNYMNAEQIKQLAEEGHSIGLHTWDHHNVKQYQGEDWVKQIEKPKAQLEKIIGKPVTFFAYPFGLWNAPAIPELKSRGLIAAFQLSTARDQDNPLYTIRRIIVTGEESGQKLITKMKVSFH
ncbi:polysaccharide deacetylase family protein [Flavihumibacter fluvii]|uniref:polysaccharide deacetylase family protein n=1 Tax=Flavihumibacter fluvii TaxID=2838157 RepID=UPI001BDEFBCE|nr:polysaccharide deacetylase family protein [Flavihumibacter fluvii]ULQ53697.1 polysaccharide deacetylase family protein [Flavihumibacter fluvii]